MGIALAASLESFRLIRPPEVDLYGATTRLRRGLFGTNKGSRSLFIHGNPAPNNNCLDE